MIRSIEVVVGGAVRVESVPRCRKWLGQTHRGVQALHKGESNCGIVVSSPFEIDRTKTGVLKQSFESPVVLERLDTAMDFAKYANVRVTPGSLSTPFKVPRTPSCTSLGTFLL